MLKNKEKQIEWWTNWMDKRFAHIDYLRLNKKYKKMYFRQCAEEIILAIDIEKEHKE